MGCLVIGFILFFILMAFGHGVEAGVTTLIILVISGVIFYKRLEKREKEENEKIAEKQVAVNQEVRSRMEELKFDVSQRYDDVLHAGQYKFLAIDENSKKIALVQSGNYRIFGYQDILESEIIVDGQEITRTSRSSQVGRALVGGLVAGGVGAIIGGVGAKQEHQSEVKKVQLKIIVNDSREPSFVLDFLKLETYSSHVTKEDNTFKNAMNRTTRLHDIMSVLIRQADDLDSRERKQEKTSVESSLVDELERLYGLMEKGILTIEEYNTQKQKLLSK